MKLELNLKNLEQIAKEKEAENISFAAYLKNQDLEKVDGIVHRLYAEIEPQIDCLECGNCCHNLRPVATDEVLRQFVEPMNMEEYRYAMSFACKNLDGKKCTIYLERPEECREYPYMHRDNYILRTHELRQNYEICPIVFNIFERLKKELGWSYK